MHRMCLVLLGILSTPDTISSNSSQDAATKPYLSPEVDLAFLAGSHQVLKDISWRLSQAGVHGQQL